MPKVSPVYEQVGSDIQTETGKPLKEWLMERYLAGARAQKMALDLTAILGYAVSVTTVRKWLVRLERGSL